MNGKSKPIVIVVLILATLWMLGHGGRVYGQGQNYPPVLQPPAQTVASLPGAAASNAGQIRVVSDSTSVAAEGQTCVGSSSNNALAYSNGTVWKCF